MKITLQGFIGEIPRVTPRMLPENAAAEADAIRITRGSLEPMQGEVAFHTLGTASTKIYLHGATWLSWAEDVDVVPGPIAEDRLYITRASGAPQLRVGGANYALALPAPTDAPTLALVGAPVDPTAIESIIYSTTWVTSLGEESAISPLSVAIDWSPNQIVTLTFSDSPPAGRLITSRRIYRSQTSLTGTTDLYFVAEISSAVGTYAHDITTAPAVEAIKSSYYDPPPADMQGLIAMPNGMMAAFSGRELCFSEPYIPHAWPVKYRLIVNDDIVGLVAFGTSLAILTTGVPYVAQGLHPDSMAMERIEVYYPCASKRGIVDMGYAAVYPSVDGLVQISSNGGASLVSDPLFTREQWLKINPASVIATSHRSRYVFNHQPTGGDRRLVTLEVAGGAATIIPVSGSSYRYLDLFYHLKTGRLFGLKEDGTSIVSIDDPDGALMDYRWKSKPFRIPGPMPFGVIYADTVPPATGTPDFSCAVYANGVLVREITAANSIERLPDVAAGPADVWEIEVSGNHEVTRVVLCGSPDEVFQ